MDYIKTENLKNYLEQAYKKLKNNTYFDKTMAVLKAQIALFEENTVDKIIDELSLALRSEEWDNYAENILNSIDILMMPKSVKQDTNENFISNYCSSEAVEIDKIQFFINMDVRGHILGVLWLLFVGKYLDNTEAMYRHSYGNRLSQKLFGNKGETSYYPCLFETYFSQYEKWRDTGLDVAKKYVNSGSDVILLTMDLTRFYYTVSYSEEEFEQIRNNVFSNKDDLDDVIIRLHKFVYDVIEKYSNKWHELACLNNGQDKKNLLPIGFLPAHILANYRLNEFDRQINDRWNPLYYGRYVDDIIIVDKIDQHSVLYKEIFENKQGTSVEKVLKLYMANCNAAKCKKCVAEGSRGLLITEKDNPKNYYINPAVLSSNFNNLGDNDDENDVDRNDTNNGYEINNGIKISVQGKKVKLFAFKKGSPDSLLQCFKQEIKRSSSEFRCWPDSEDARAYDDISRLYNLQYNGSINKLNSIDSVSVDKFELSKFLGKQMIFASLVKDKPNTWVNSWIKCLTPDVIASCYSSWERIFEILLLTKSYDELKQISLTILKVIENIKLVDNNTSDLVSIHNNQINEVKSSMLAFFIASLSRVLAISWKDDAKNVIAYVEKYIEKLHLDKGGYIELDLDKLRKKYCMTRMINKYLLPFSLNMFSINDEFMNGIKIDLFDFYEVFKFIKQKGLKDADCYDNGYKFLPVVLTPQEINYTLRTIALLYNHDVDEKIVFENLTQIYIKTNYGYSDIKNNITQSIGLYKLKKGSQESASEENELKKDSQKIVSKENELKRKYGYFICVGNKQKPDAAKIRVAIANAKVYEKDFINFLSQKPNRTFHRYSEIQKILRVAIEEKADMVVLPECYIPYEWIYRLVNWSANNQIAIITGIEHFATFGKTSKDISSHDNCVVHNMTATILPYKLDDYKYSHLVFQHKKFPSPFELKTLNNYGYSFYEPEFSDEDKKRIWQNSTFLFWWHNIWFPVYNCFEMASIKLRQQHSDYLDMVVAVECNKDIPYYSDIIGSLARDLHCCCIQVNSSNYGDSRIIEPTKRASMNIIQTKGGDNFTALVSAVDIEALRSFQLQKYYQYGKKFKPTPPGFNHYIVGLKVNNQLFDKCLKRLN